jgi:hypothetical protein
MNIWLINPYDELPGEGAEGRYARIAAELAAPPQEIGAGRWEMLARAVPAQEMPEEDGRNEVVWVSSMFRHRTRTQFAGNVEGECNSAPARLPECRPGGLRAGAPAAREGPSGQGPPPPFFDSVCIEWILVESGAQPHPEACPKQRGGQPFRPLRGLGLHNTGATHRPVEGHPFGAG